MRRRSFLAGLGASALTGSLAGCSSGFSRDSQGDGTLRMTMWTSDPEQLALFKTIASEFMATNTTVTDIRFESLTLDQLDMVLTSGITADSAPDLSWLPVESSLEYIEAGALLDVEPVLTTTDGYDYDDLVPRLQEPWRVDNAQYGVPFSTGPLIMYFNKDLYDEAGVRSPAELLADNDWTWESFRRTSKELKDATGVPGYVVNDFEFRNWTRLLPLLYAYGASPWSTDATRCTVDSPEMRAALGVFNGMVFDDHSSPVPGQQVDFWGGQAGATSAFLGSSILLESATFDWDIVPTPRGPAGDGQALGQAAIVALTAGKNHQAALEFLAYLTKAENARRISRFFPPARKSLLNPEILAKSSGILTKQQLEPLVDSISKRARIFPVAANAASVANALDSALDEFVYVPGVDLDEALPKVCHAIEPVLSA